jgi:hypothetical protein
LECFCKTFTAPYYTGKLFDDVGFIGDTECARQILEDTYLFPKGTDPVTRLLLEETVVTFEKLSGKEVSSYVTVKDFQHYWQQVSERTSSLYSVLHFGHYKAVPFDHNLAVLHTAKLSAMLEQ